MTQPERSDSTDTANVLADLVDVTLIWDAALGSPAGKQALGGRTIGVPKSAIPLPLRGVFLGEPGFGRQQTVTDPGDPAQTIVRWEWVLQGGTDPVDVFVDSLTGRPGWVVPQSRAVLKLMIQRLFSAGIPRATIAQQIPQLYAAIAAEVRAEDHP